MSLPGRRSLASPRRRPISRRQGPHRVQSFLLGEVRFEALLSWSFNASDDGSDEHLCGRIRYQLWCGCVCYSCLHLSPRVCVFSVSISIARVVRLCVPWFKIRFASHQTTFFANSWSLGSTAGVHRPSRFNLAAAQQCHRRRRRLLLTTSSTTPETPCLPWFQAPTISWLPGVNLHCERIFSIQPLAL